MNAQENPMDMQKQMRKTGLKIALVMALLMSFTLSFVGNLLAERPPEMPMGPIVMGFLMSFAISFVVSFAIGVLVPMPKVNAALARKFHLQQGTPKAGLVESFFSNLIYTPLITFVMVSFVYFVLMPAGSKPPFLPMFLHSLVVCFVVAQVILFFCTPLVVKRLLPKNVQMKQ